MEITQAIRETAFTACWNQRAKLIKRRDLQIKKSSIHVHNTQRQILDLDDAINMLRY